MKSPERLSPEDQDNLWEIRENVDRVLGKPYPVEAKALVWQYKLSLEKAIFDPLFSDKKKLKTHLAKIKQELYPDNPYSRPLVCASQVNYAKEAIMAEARLTTAVFSNQDSQLKFATLFDFAHGMGLVVNPIAIAEDNLRNPSETTLSNVVDYWAERFDLDHVENAEAFLKARRLASHFAELLKKDASGLSLTRDVAKLLKDYKYKEKQGIYVPLLQQSYQVREFVSAGVDLGGKLYKKLYPLTD